jgi:hypothetical protein
MSSDAGPTIGAYLADLEVAAGQLADTWRPDDPAYRADLYRQIMMNLSYSYFAFFHADAEHPDWAPLWNPVYTDQPNPDDIYLYAPIRGDLTYRVSGERGTVALLTFNTQKGWVGLVDDMSQLGHGRDFDDNSLTVGPNGELEIIFSAQRPGGHAGNWAQIAPEADAMVVRYRSIDWVGERDPRLSIECLNPVPPKPRLSPEQILRRIEEMAKLPGRYGRAFLAIQNNVKAEAGINAFVRRQYPGGGLSKQIYWPAVFELEDGEALIIETEMPKVRPYWNIQLNDPYFNAVEYVYRLSSLNAATAQISPDGRFRAIVALEDPGVPNWLDPAGFKQGTIYGRWYDCDINPLPTIKRVPLSELRRHLPDDTPAVTPQDRAKELATRVRAAQRRRRW